MIEQSFVQIYRSSPPLSINNQSMVEASYLVKTLRSNELTSISILDRLRTIVCSILEEYIPKGA